MKHLMIADKSLLAGDEAVDLLIEYAALLGQEGTADSVDLRAVGSDGDEVTATFLLNGGISIIAESSTSHLPDPENRKAEEYLHTQITRLRGLHSVSPEEIAGAGIWDPADTP